MKESESWDPRDIRFLPTCLAPRRNEDYGMTREQWFDLRMGELNRNLFHHGIFPMFGNSTYMHGELLDLVNFSFEKYYGCSLDSIVELAGIARTPFSINEKDVEYWCEAGCVFLGHPVERRD